MVPIHPKVMDVLIYFVQRPREVVTADQLIEAVWGDESVSSNNIVQHVSLVRRTLGDTRKPFVYIATVPGKGYRFVAEEPRFIRNVEAIVAPSQIEQANLAAEQFHHNGRYFLGIRTEAALFSAIELFMRAIHLNPQDARSYAGIAQAHMILAVYLYSEPETSFDTAEKYARQALAIDSSNAEAYSALGAAAFFRWKDFARAHRYLDKAGELDPGMAQIATVRTQVLAAEQRFDAALSVALEGSKANPDLTLLRSLVGFVHFARRDYAAAALSLSPLLAIDPVLTHPRFYLGLTYLFSGEIAKARAELEHVCAQNFQPLQAMQTNLRQQAMAALCFLEARFGAKSRAHDHLSALRAMQRTRHVSPYALAVCLCGLGRYEEMFARLKHAMAIGDPWAAFINISPYFDGQRSEREFLKLAGSEAASAA
ncbi:MAG TPA: winged helix-turn-helix domain-containing protein [Candidatus Rubrimentiphilum sp.]|nr:winged helix-turn-helix domain-containing protein [Candidatus Rubrimentiphilum sp.]